MKYIIINEYLNIQKIGTLRHNYCNIFFLILIFNYHIFKLIINVKMFMLFFEFPISLLAFEDEILNSLLFLLILWVLKLWLWARFKVFWLYLNWGTLFLLFDKWALFFKYPET